MKHAILNHRNRQQQRRDGNKQMTMIILTEQAANTIASLNGVSVKEALANHQEEIFQMVCVAMAQQKA